MSSETHFFALTEAEFGRVLRGWKHPVPPLSVPRALEFLNPFTKELVRSSTRVSPVQPLPDVDAVPWPKLDARQAVMKWKSVFAHDLAELAVAIGVESTLEEASDALRCGELRWPGTDPVFVYEIPRNVVEGLARATDDELIEGSRKWSELRGVDACPRWSTDDLHELVSQLRELAQHAVGTECRMYMWC